MWKFKSQNEVWNEFMVYYTTLIIDSNAKFDHEYLYELEVNQIYHQKFAILKHDLIKT